MPKLIEAIMGDLEDTAAHLQEIKESVRIIARRARGMKREDVDELARISRSADGGLERVFTARKATSGIQKGKVEE